GGGEDEQQFRQPPTANVGQFRLLQVRGQVQGLADAAFDRGAIVADDLQEGVYQPQGVGPVEPGAIVQFGRLDDVAVGPRLEALAFGELAGEDVKVVGVFGGPAPLVGGGRGAGETHPHSPVVAHRDEYEGEEPARQRLGLVAELLVDAAAALFRQKDAALPV